MPSIGSQNSGICGAGAVCPVSWVVRLAQVDLCRWSQWSARAPAAIRVAMHSPAIGTRNQWGGPSTGSGRAAQSWTPGCQGPDGGAGSVLRRAVSGRPCRGGGSSQTNCARAVTAARTPMTTLACSGYYVVRNRFPYVRKHQMPGAARCQGRPLRRWASARRRATLRPARSGAVSLHDVDRRTAPRVASSRR